MAFPFHEEGQQSEDDNERADTCGDDADDELGRAGGIQKGRQATGEDEENSDEQAETAYEEHPFHP